MASCEDQSNEKPQMFLKFSYYITQVCAKRLWSVRFRRRSLDGLKIEMLTDSLMILLLRRPGSKPTPTLGRRKVCEKYLLPEEKPRDALAQQLFPAFPKFSRGERKSRVSCRRRTEVVVGKFRRVHRERTATQRGVALSQQPNSIIVSCVAYTIIRTRCVCVYAPRRYKETLTTGFRSVAGKLSGLAVGEGLRTAKRRRAAAGVAQEARACARGGVAARRDAAPSLSRALRAAASLAFFGQSGQTSTLSD